MSNHIPRDIVDILRYDAGSRPGGICEAAAKEIERLRAELAAAKRDAERYRWLRGDCPDHSIRWTQWEVRTWLAPQWTSDLRFTHLDVAIDAAMKGEE